MPLVHRISKNGSRTLEMPFLFLERGYFLDIKHFFGGKSLSGFKLLCGVCNLNCYYCHRIPHFKNMKNTLLSDIKKEMNKWEPYNIVTLTGGEITLLPKQAIYLMKNLHKSNKYVAFSTNASNKTQIAEMVKFADAVKIDLKASRKNMKKVCGINYYDDALESISMCASTKRPMEVKILIHAFTSEYDIKTRLIDLEKTTGYPQSMIIQFQLIYDFLNQGIGVKNGDRYRDLCKNMSHVPDTVLFKQYSNVETIEILDEGKWKLFAKKRIPLVIGHQKSSGE